MHISIVGITGYTGLELLRLALNHPHVTISSVIDNLIKGAAGQAIQNMNLMFNYDETDGLILAPLYI